MPEDRKRIPLASGVFDYFPDALVEVAKVSFVGNEKHNPGEPLHWSRGKSNDHPDAMLRHFKDRGKMDPENKLRHSAEMAWRALAILQEELETAGAPLARGARLLEKPLPEPPYPALARILAIENVQKRRAAWNDHICVAPDHDCWQCTGCRVLGYYE